MLIIYMLTHSCPCFCAASSSSSSPPPPPPPSTFSFFLFSPFVLQFVVIGALASQTVFSLLPFWLTLLKKKKKLWVLHEDASKYVSFIYPRFFLLFSSCKSGILMFCCIVHQCFTAMAMAVNSVHFCYILVHGHSMFLSFLNLVIVKFHFCLNRCF
jgi:hypothetical protein